MSWLDRLGGASVDQIRRRFQLGRTQGYRRLQVLEGFGLVRRVDLLVRLPALYVSSRREVRPWNFEHTLLVTDLIVDLELAGRMVLEEREVRRERFLAGLMEARLNPVQMTVLVGCEHTPDAIEVCPNEELAAYEIEIASKGRARRESILLRYALSDYERVEWIIPVGSWHDSSPPTSATWGSATACGSRMAGACGLSPAANSLRGFGAGSAQGVAERDPGLGQREGVCLAAFPRRDGRAGAG